MSQPSTHRHITPFSATCIVIANIIGTGVFTSLGFQAADLPADFPILLLWIVGGVLSLCGGLTYAELGSALPRSGGEYHYLSKLYHPAVGFLSGWISGTVAFAAPMALAALAFGEYVSTAFSFLSPKILASLVLLYVAAMHWVSLNGGDRFQSWSTIIKLIPIIFLIVIGSFSSQGRPLTMIPVLSDRSLILSPAFAVSLVYVSYAYSGWNASTYLASEIKDSGVTIPISIILGTVIVAVLYLALNMVFLRTIPMGELQGKLQIGILCAHRLFGESGRKIMSLLIGVGLVSTISSMVLAGSRVLEVIGEDFSAIRFLAAGRTGNPRAAILIQTSLALIMLITSTFDHVLTYIGFILAIFTTLTVLGVFRLRAKQIGEKDHYRTWGYPVTPLIFVVFNCYMMFYLFTQKPSEAYTGLLTVFVGFLVYIFIQRKSSAMKEHSR